MASSNSGIRSLDDLMGGNTEKKSLPSLDELMKPKEQPKVVSGQTPTPAHIAKPPKPFPSSSMSPAPQTIPSPLPFPKYVGNKAEEIMTQFANGVTNEITGGLAKSLGAQAPDQGTTAGYVARGIGELAGAVPVLGFGAELIGSGIKAATSLLPPVAKSIIALATRVGFTVAPIVGIVKNSENFFNAVKAKDHNAIVDSATGAIIDSAFAFLMGKGWVDDAKTLKASYEQLKLRRTPEWQASQYEAARRKYAETGTWPTNIWPNPNEQPIQTKQSVSNTVSTLAEAEKIINNTKEMPDLKPSVELETHVDAKDNLADSKAKVDEIKSQPLAIPDSFIPKQSGAMVTGAQLDEISSLTGKEIDDIEDKDVEDYLAGRLKQVEKPSVETPTPIEEPEPDVDETFHEAKEAFEDNKVPVNIDEFATMHEADRQTVNRMMQRYGIPSQVKLNDEFATLHEADQNTVSRIVQRYGLPEVSPKKEVELFKDPIEQYYGKPASEISEEEVTKFYNLEEPVKDIDIEIGNSPEPEALISASDSPYSMSKEATENARENYSKSKSVANSIEELLNSDPTKIQKDPGTTLWANAAEVNGWLHGDDKVDINARRNFLSQIAANAELFRYQFAGGEDYPQSFFDWKENASDMANWARKADRLGMERTRVLNEYEEAKAKGKINLMRSGGPSTEEILKGTKTWYSALKYYAQTKLGNKMSGKQVKQTLRKNATADEWANVKMDDLFEDNTVYTKEEVLRKIDEGKTEFKDVMLSEEKGPKVIQTGLDSFRISDADPVYGTNFLTREAAERYLLEIRNTRSKGEGEPKYSTYQELGGQDYKELFVTAPNLTSEVGGTPVSQILKDRRITRVPQTWQDGHPDYSDIENPIVRLRFNTRYTSDGKKVLFLEEMQPPNPSEQEKMPPHLIKRWREIGMKRAVMYAIENGYDKVAWTTGEMQANRYSLDERISILHYGTNPDGTYWMAAEGNGTFDVNSIPKDKVVEYVGPDTAAKIFAGEGEEGKNKLYHERILSGQDLKVKNRGLRQLYDRDLPNVAKKLGGKVENIKLRKVKEGDTLVNWTPGKEMTVAEQTMTVPSFDIAPLSKNLQLHFMYSGGPSTDEVMKALYNAAKNVRDTYDKAKKLNKPTFKDIEKNIRKNFVRYGIDTAGNISKEFIDKYKDPGFEVMLAHDAARNASSLARVQLQQAFKEIYSGLNKQETEVIDKLTRAMRMLAISKSPKGSKFHFPPGYTPQESQAYISMFQQLENLTPQRALELQQRADAFFEWAKQPVKDASAEGLIDQKEADDLMQYNYLKTRLADLFDRELPTGEVGSIRRSVYDSGVEPLQVGKQTDIYEPSSKLLMLEQFDRMYGRIMNFRANKALQQFAWDNKGNDLVRSKKDSKGEKTDEKIPPGWKSIHVGEEDTLYISPLMAKEWVNNSREISYMLANVLRIGSGTGLLRPFATGLDWGFALANFGRHLVHAQFTSRTFIEGKWTPVYNPIVPIAIGQLGKNLNNVIPDLLTRSGQYIDYLKQGATLRSLTGEGLDVVRRGRHVPDSFDAIMNFGGKLGNLGEAAVRLAVRDQTIRYIAKQRKLSYKEAYKDPKIQQMGTFAANDYLPFGQGGGAIKALNNIFPFLNAATQATRSMIRPFTSNAESSAYSFLKLAQFGLVVVGTWYANKLLNPKTMKELDGNSVTEGNIIIPLGDSFGFTDDKGQTRYPYIKIPVAQSLRFFKVAFEDAAGLAIGHKQDNDRLLSALQKSSPAEVSLVPPFMAAREAYLHNYDIQQGKDIMPEKGLFSWPKSAEEIKSWDPPPKILQDLGKATGLSPERMRRAGGDLVTSNSMWFTLGGKGYDFAMGKASQKNNSRAIAQIIADMPIANRFFGLTNPSSKFTKDIVEEREESNYKTWTQNLGLDTLVDQYLSNVDVSRGDINAYIHTFRDVKVQDRLFDRMEFNMQMRKLDDERWWSNLRGLPAEARANLYWKRKSTADDEELVKMRREESQVIAIEGSKLKGSRFNIFGPEFYDELSRVRRGITK